VQELKELQRQGMSIQEISKLTGWDRKTIRKHMQAAGLAREYGPDSIAEQAGMPSSRTGRSDCGPGCETHGCCCANCASVTMQAATRF
jgi:hypothetical protein